MGMRYWSVIVSIDRFKNALELKFAAHKCRAINARTIEIDGVQMKLCGQYYGPQEIKVFDYMPSMFFCDKMGKN